MGNYYLIKGKIKNNVYKIDKISNYECLVHYPNGTYKYNIRDIKRVTLIEEYNPAHVNIVIARKKISNIAEVKVFKDSNNIIFLYVKCLNEEYFVNSDYKITECYENMHLDYLKYLSKNIKIENNNFLEIYYKNINKDTSSLLNYYLNPNNDKLLSYDEELEIYPFGINSSQKKATTNALTNQISIIQGPPGTGKTQTILNIIANLLIKGKSVCVVSNNNQATHNVLEKLEQNDLGFLVADIGSKKNKEEFVNREEKYLDILDKWNMEFDDFEKKLSSKLKKINYKLQLEEELAKLRNKLTILENEQRHYINLFKSLTNTFEIIFRKKKTAEKVLQTKILAEKYLSNKTKFSLLSKLKLKYLHGVY